MHGNRLVLMGSAVAAVIALSACGPQSTSAATSTSTAPAASSAAAPSSAAAADPADDPATTKACGDLRKDIRDNAAKVAKAKKIGPPAGNIAVSAQWAAGSTAVIAHSIGAAGAVGTAADRVQKEMMNLSEEYNKSASAKPSEKKLEAAIKDLDAACSAA